MFKAPKVPRVEGILFGKGELSWCSSYYTAQKGVHFRAVVRLCWSNPSLGVTVSPGRGRSCLLLSATNRMTVSVMMVASCGHGCVLWEAVEDLCLSVSLRQGIHLGNSRALVWHPASNTPLEFGVLPNLGEPPHSLSVLTSVAAEPWLSSCS